MPRPDPRPRMVGASLVVQMVKNMPVIQEIQVRSLGREDILEKRTATHSSIPVWRIPWTEELAGYSSWAHKESDTTERLRYTVGKGGYEIGIF